MSPKKDVQKICTEYGTNHQKMFYYTYFQHRFYPHEHNVRSKKLEFRAGINVTTKLFKKFDTAFRQGHTSKSELKKLNIPTIYSDCKIGRRLEYSVSRNQTPTYYTYLATPHDGLSTITHRCQQVGLNYQPTKVWNNMQQINIVLKYSDPASGQVTYREQGKKNQMHFSFSYELNIHLNSTDVNFRGVAPLDDLSTLPGAITEKIDAFFSVVDTNKFNVQNGNWLFGVAIVPSTVHNPNPRINSYIDS